ncbi:MAG TPA: hypothetical protein VHB98_13660, partial [Chloroflexota bacterium]|nr:hypothetical protein [Chloroflexota bacterium]
LTTLIGGAGMAQGAGRAAAPCMPAGYGAPGATPVFIFGHMGGNIRPTRIAIYSDGTITYQGGRPLSTSYHIRPAAVLGLERLAQAEGVSTMPSLIKAPHWLPDFGTNYITVRAGCSAKVTTIRAQGSVSGGFSELYYTLAAATAAQL